MILCEIRTLIKLNKKKHLNIGRNVWAINGVSIYYTQTYRVESNFRPRNKSGSEAEKK